MKINCRLKICRISVTVLLSATALLGSCGAAAQAGTVGEPLQGQTQPAPAIQPENPDRPVYVPKDFTPGAAIEPNREVEISGLGSPEGEATGLLDSSNGGLGDAIWASSARADVIADVQKLSLAKVDSLRELARRLLLTRAPAPLGDAPQTFLSARLKKLLELGFIEEAAIIAANARISTDPQTARDQADAILLAGHANDACSTATSTRLTQADLFWLELRAYCFAASGDGASLELTQNLMAAQNLDDPGFNALLANFVSHGNAPLPAIDRPSALHVFLLQKLGQHVDSASFSKAGALMTVPAADTRGMLVALKHEAAASRLASARFDAISFLLAPDPAHDPDLRDSLNWYAAELGRQSNDDFSARCHAAATLLVYRALSEPMTQPASEASKRAGAVACWPGSLLDPNVSRLVALAMNDVGRRGEAIASLLDDLDSGDVLDRLSPDSLAQIVRALKEFAGGPLAQQFAAEALLLFKPGPPPAPTTGQPAP